MSVIYDAHYGIFDDTTINPGDDYITNTLIWQGYDNGGTPDGQIVYGGNSAGKNLTLTSTFDGTKGNIYLGTALNSVYDEVNDRLGIGTNAPTKLLSVVSDSIPSIMISNSASRAIGNQERLLFGIDDIQNIHAIIFAENTGGMNGASALGFYTFDGTTGNERMRIDSAGNVGIGTTSPLAKLDLQVLENTYQTIDTQFMNIGIRTFGEFDHSETSENYYTASAFSTVGTQWNHTDNANYDYQLANYAFDGTMYIGGTNPHFSVGGNFKLLLETSRDDSFNWENDGVYQFLAAAGYFTVNFDDTNANVIGEIAAGEFGINFLTESASFDSSSRLVGVSVLSPGYPDGFSGINTSIYGVHIKNQGYNGVANDSYGIYIDDQNDGTNPTYSIYSEGGTNYFGGNVGVGVEPIVGGSGQEVWLSLDESTTAKAPLAFTPPSTPGTKLTNPLNGAVEYDGKNFYFTTPNSVGTPTQSQAVTAVPGGAVTPTSPPAPTLFYTQALSPSGILADPDQWLTVTINIGGTPTKFNIPAYI